MCRAKLPVELGYSIVFLWSDRGVSARGVRACTFASCSMSDYGKAARETPKGADCYFKRPRRIVAKVPHMWRIFVSTNQSSPIVVNYSCDAFFSRRLRAGPAAGPWSSASSGVPVSDLCA